MNSKRFQYTLEEAERIRKTGFRFDKSFRQADADSPDLEERMKAAFYEKCCTFAANSIADDPASAEGWKRSL